VALTLVVRSSQARKQFAGDLQSVVSQLKADVPVTQIETLQGWLADAVAGPRSTASLFSVFAALALVLGAVGVYGVISYSVAQRTREIGIRMALGAQRGTVVRLIVREVMVLAGGAVAVTIPLAMLATQAVRSQLFGVSIADPAVYGVGILVICAVAALAGFVPARRAATVDPARALRND
jgi:ABC-type antimicrobial peptide transport system permease subunit